MKYNRSHPLRKLNMSPALDTGSRSRWTGTAQELLRAMHRPALYHGTILFDGLRLPPVLLHTGLIFSAANRAAGVSLCTDSSVSGKYRPHLQTE